MEGTITTILSVLSAFFIAWALVADPDLSSTNGGTDFIGVIIMLPIVGLMLAGIILLFPTLIALAVILLIAALLLFLAYMILRHLPKLIKVLRSLASFAWQSAKWFFGTLKDLFSASGSFGKFIQRIMKEIANAGGLIGKLFTIFFKSIYLLRYLFWPLLMLFGLLFRDNEQNERKEKQEQNHMKYVLSAHRESSGKNKESLKKKTFHHIQKRVVSRKSSTSSANKVFAHLPKLVVQIIKETRKASDMRTFHKQH